MKKSFFHLVIVLFAAVLASPVITSCERKSATEQAEGDQKTDSTHQHDGMEMDSTKMAYACPMHPEMTGKKGDKCSKCDMMLVKTEKGEADEHKH